MYCYCDYNTPGYYRDTFDLVSSAGPVPGQTTFNLVSSTQEVIPVPLTWTVFFTSIPVGTIPTAIQTRCDTETLNRLVRHLRILDTLPFDQPMRRGLRAAVFRDLQNEGQTVVNELFQCSRSLGTRYLPSIYAEFWRNQGWGNIPM